MAVLGDEMEEREERLDNCLITKSRAHPESAGAAPPHYAAAVPPMLPKWAAVLSGGGNWFRKTRWTVGSLL